MASVVSFWKYVKVEGKWRYKVCVMDRGVPVNNMVLVDERTEYHGEGSYYLRVKKQWITAALQVHSTEGAHSAWIGALPQAGRPKNTHGLSPSAVFLLSAGLRTIYKISQDPDRPEPQPAGPQRSAYPDPSNSGCYRSRGRGPDPRP